jgi:transposase
MPSDFEIALLPNLRHAIPDLLPEYPIEGKGKHWVANLYSKKRSIVIEACSRNVVRTGKGRTSIQHYDKFYAMVMKLADIKQKHPSIKPIMIWKNLIPAYSTDLGLCTAWGVYVQSNEDLNLESILDGKEVGYVNRRALQFLIRRTDTFKPRWRWLVAERPNDIVNQLETRAMGTKEIAGAIGVDYATHKSSLSKMLRELESEGRIMKLAPGYVAGKGAIYGVDSKQLDALERETFGIYGTHKRRERIGQRIVQLLNKEGPMDYKQVQSKLSQEWGIDATRETVVGTLSKFLLKRGLVYRKGGPKAYIYGVRA